jgi:hypothetical protein
MAPNLQQHAILPLSMRLWPILAVLSLAAGVLGCDAASDAEDAPTTTVAATAEPTTLATYCRGMCDRTAVCGFELAKRQAGPADGKTLEKLEADLPDDKAACERGCRETTLDDDAPFQLERAEICLRKSSCDELTTCVAAL